MLPEILWNAFLKYLTQVENEYLIFGFYVNNKNNWINLSVVYVQYVKFFRNLSNWKICTEALCFPGICYYLQGSKIRIESW